MRALFRLMLFLVLLGLGLAVLTLDRSPAIARPEPPSARDVTEARALVHRIRALSRGEDAAPGDVAISEATLNAVLRMGTRMAPGLRARARIGSDTLELRGAAPLPLAGLWVNVEAVVPAFEDGPDLAELRVGRLSLPPALAMAALRIGGDLALGDGAGARLLETVPALTVEPDRIVARLDLDSRSRSDFAARAFGALRGDRMPTAEAIADHYRAIRTAIDDGTLPDRGSVMPHLRFALARARAAATAGEDRANAYTAAIFGLADACGAKDFAMIADRLVTSGTDDPDTWTRDCRKVTLSGRVDTKRHFITSAALQAASNRGVAVSIGEFKELYDIRNSGGFDFTDMAADLAGVRLSDRLMDPGSDWSLLLSPGSGEADIMVGLDGIPGKLKAKVFAERYGSVDSPAYRAELDRIEARIDALPLHQRP